MADSTAEILLVEDSPDDVSLFMHAFKKSGVTARLRIAHDGAEALEFILAAGNHSPPDATGLPKVIILDLKLPKVDGLEVLRQLKADPRTAPIPVVVLSSSQEERDLVTSYKLGANSYIVKPMDFDEFTESVRMTTRYWLQFNQIPRP